MISKIIILKLHSTLDIQDVTNLFCVKTSLAVCLAEISKLKFVLYNWSTFRTCHKRVERSSFYIRSWLYVLLFLWFLICLFILLSSSSSSDGIWFWVEVIFPRIFFRNTLNRFFVNSAQFWVHQIKILKNKIHD